MVVWSRVSFDLGVDHFRQEKKKKINFKGLRAGRCLLRTRKELGMRSEMSSQNTEGLCRSELDFGFCLGSPALFIGSH